MLNSLWAGDLVQNNTLKRDFYGLKVIPRDRRRGQAKQTFTCVLKIYFIVQSYN